MSLRTSYGRAVGALAMAIVLIVMALPSAAEAQTRGRMRPTRPAPPVTTPTPPPAPSVDADDAEFVEMMIPHHHQALIMSRMAPARSSDEGVLALAARIDVEQGVEIGMLQNWQRWNGLPVTDAEHAYHMMLHHHAMHLEEMGMATPEELDALSASSGTAFDRQFLELMIPHHEGAVRMLTDVIINGSDLTLQFWATDMMTAQDVQIWQMEQMLDDLS